MDNSTEIIPGSFEVTEDQPQEAMPVEVKSDGTIAYPPLTQEEETFALAIIESGGNVPAAYRMAFGTEAPFPAARGKELLLKPAIVLKIKAINDAMDDSMLISVGAHLDSLAQIRDLAIATGQLKVALNAEKSRGEAVGIYQRHDKGKGGGGTTAVQINLTMASKHDENI